MTTEVKRAYYFTYLYGCTGDKGFFAEAHQITDVWLLEKATAKQKEIVKDLQDFKKLRIG